MNSEEMTEKMELFDERNAKRGATSMSKQDGQLLVQVDEALAKVFSHENFSEDTKAAMKYRCGKQGHDYENCMSITMQVYQTCRWCGDVR